MTGWSISGFDEDIFDWNNEITINGLLNVFEFEYIAWKKFC